MSLLLSQLGGGPPTVTGTIDVTTPPPVMLATAAHGVSATLDATTAAPVMVATGSSVVGSIATATAVPAMLIVATASGGAVARPWSEPAFAASMSPSAASPFSNKPASVWSD